MLLFSTLHTSSAANTINRIVDVFPANQQVQVRGQLAQLIKGVVCQQLVTSADGHLIPVSELEVEWYYGSEDDFMELAHRIQSKYGLEAEDRSKLQRAFE